MYAEVAKLFVDISFGFPTFCSCPSEFILSRIHLMNVKTAEDVLYFVDRASCSDSW